MECIPAKNSELINPLLAHLRICIILSSDMPGCYGPLMVACVMFGCEMHHHVQLFHHSVLIAASLV